MTNTVPYNKEESEQSIDCDYSVVDVSISNNLQPQHLSVPFPLLGNSVDDCIDAVSTKANCNSSRSSILKSGMNNSRKRGSNSSNDSTAISEQLQPPSPPPNKKPCVSFFCNKKDTTTASSLVTKNNTRSTQCPFLANIHHQMNHSVSCTSLPQYATTSTSSSLPWASTGELDLSTSPADFVKTILLQSGGGSILRGEELISTASKRLQKDNYFVTYTNEHLEAYTTDMTRAVQGNDIKTLRSLMAAGHSMQASNRFGETMLHTSCRRGFTNMVSFFLHEAKISPRVRDDMGRTPMHDACWSSSAPKDMFDMVKILIKAAPEMLLSIDKRGHSPFDYARREFWPQWVAFLNENRVFIVNSLVESCLDELGGTVAALSKNSFHDEQQIGSEEELTCR